MIIGITGGIGSGKSEAAKIIANEGYKLVDADAISREVTAKGSKALEELPLAFGNDIILNDGSLDRGTLRNRAFQTELGIEKLNNIVVSKIIEISKERLVGDCVYDAPTLLENHLENLVDVVILVTADESLRINRVMQRSNLSEDDVLKIIHNQMPESEKMKRADYIIYNNGSIDELKIELIDTLRKISNYSEV